MYQEASYDERNQYRQCRLIKEERDVCIVNTCWIPIQFAKVGKMLRIDTEEGWIVEEVWDLIQNEKYLSCHRESWKRFDNILYD